MFLYVMKTGLPTIVIPGERVKIGISKNPRRRSSSLTTSNPDGVQLFGAAAIVGLLARQAEKRAHELLSPFKVSGEWFDINPWFALTVVEHVANGSQPEDIMMKVLRLAVVSNRLNRPSRRDSEELWQAHRVKWKAATEAVEASDWTYKANVLLRL